MSTMISGEEGVNKVAPDALIPFDPESSGLTSTDLSDAIKELASRTFGIGQSWVDVTGSRGMGTTYTNNTNRPILVTVARLLTSNQYLLLYVDGNIRTIQRNLSTSTYEMWVTALVPPGSTYQAYTSAGATDYMY